MVVPAQSADAGCRNLQSSVVGRPQARYAVMAVLPTDEVHGH